MFALDTHDPQITSADGLKIWAAQAGQSAKDAPTIVFIPGYASSSLLFDHQFRDEELLSKYCLVCSFFLAPLASLFFSFLASLVLSFFGFLALLVMHHR